MVYLITGQPELFEDPSYKVISIEESLQLLNSCKTLQFDTETTGVDSRLCDILCFQFGNKKKDFQMVIDNTTVPITIYKNVLESKYIIGQNLKFDLQFCYNYGIKPRRVYDTMIVEQLLHLGYPSGVISYSLAAIAQRRLGIDIDKSIRGQIIWRGLDSQVIEYAANDVKWLEDIMWSQVEDCKQKDCLVGAKLECDAVPSIAYLEWCGIKLDEVKWKIKMDNDKKQLSIAKKALDDFVINHPDLSKFIKIERQGDLFMGFSTEPECTINWSSSRQVIEVAKILGFNTTVQDKKTGEDKDSVLEKHLSGQKGINDKFITLYLGKGNPGDSDYYIGYQGAAKVVSSFGQGHLNAVNPKTGRIHTIYRQLATSSGRLSCGSNQPNKDLAKYKGISSKDCSYPNMQQLPSNEETRAAFVAPEGYLFVSADFSAEESRLGADIYQDQEMLKEFIEGTGDMHSLFAWMVFRKECEVLGCTSAKEVKKKAPQWRKAVKAVELSYADSL